MNNAPAIINDHSDWVYCVALSPDGKTIVSGSKSKTSRILITNIDISSLIINIRNSISNNMSSSNWLKYIGEGIDYPTVLPEI